MVDAEVLKFIDTKIREARVHRDRALTPFGVWRCDGKIAALQDLRKYLTGRPLQ